MQFQRLSPKQVFVSAPVEAVREAAWYTLWNGRVQSPLIDVQKNVVSGPQGDGFITTVRIVTASFETRPEGTLVSFESKPLFSNTELLTRWRAKQFADMFERVLISGYGSQPAQGHYQAAPLSDPLGGGGSSSGSAGPMPVFNGQPLYGAVLAPKRGITLLIYGVLSLMLCPILAPLTLLYGFGALRDYKRQGNPGDSGLVVAGMALATLDLLVVLFLIFGGV